MQENYENRSPNDFSVGTNKTNNSKWYSIVRVRVYDTNDVNGTHLEFLYNLRDSRIENSIDASTDQPPVTIDPNQGDENIQNSSGIKNNNVCELHLGVILATTWVTWSLVTFTGV